MFRATQPASEHPDPERCSPHHLRPARRSTLPTVLAGQRAGRGETRVRGPDDHLGRVSGPRPVPRERPQCRDVRGEREARERQEEEGEEESATEVQDQRCGRDCGESLAPLRQTLV